MGGALHYLRGNRLAAQRMESCSQKEAWNQHMHEGRNIRIVNLTELIDRYIAARNEPNAERLRDLIARIRGWLY